MGDTDLYDILGVGQNASDTEIKKSYHRLAKQYHPDKNPGPAAEEKFKEIQSAYEILSDSQKRQMYDRFGISAVKGEGADMAGDSPFGSIFSMFGGGGDIFGRRRVPKAETIGLPLEVTLEELYNGATKHVEYKRNILCKTCNGTGGKSGTVSSCKTCRGSGIKVALRQIGPGMMQQMQSQCSDCNGTGDFIRDKDKCKKCRGRKLVEVEHKQEVLVSMGMKHEQKIPFQGMADEMPDGEPGDMIVILQQLDHPDYRRDGCDLFVERHISLREALCGFTCVLDTLDGRKLRLSTPAGVVLSPGCVHGVEGEGMPIFKRPDVRGNLYLQYTIDFPPSNFLDEEKLKELESLLPTRPDEPAMFDLNAEDTEEVDMIESELTRGDGGERGGRAAYDSDDEEEGMGGGQRVGCSQQ